MEAHFGQPVKQYPGQQQVDRAVVVNAPGRHWPGLTPAQQKQVYPVTAVEYRERHNFPRHIRAWGAAGRFPGIRFTCQSDTVEDPDSKGFWTTLALWNKWRADTYADNPEKELPFLDPLLEAKPTAVEETSTVEKVPELKQHFDAVSMGNHTVGGSGRMAGKVFPFVMYACRHPGCMRGWTLPLVSCLLCMHHNIIDTMSLKKLLPLCGPLSTTPQRL